MHHNRFLNVLLTPSWKGLQSWLSLFIVWLVPIFIWFWKCLSCISCHFSDMCPFCGFEFKLTYVFIVQMVYSLNRSTICHYFWQKRSYKTAHFINWKFTAYNKPLDIYRSIKASSPVLIPIYVIFQVFIRLNFYNFSWFWFFDAANSLESFRLVRGLNKAYNIEFLLRVELLSIVEGVRLLIIFSYDRVQLFCCVF